jgi:hypothetical protein
VKGAITGTYRSIDIRHTARYLADGPRLFQGYDWRFNRRFELPKNLERLDRFAERILLFFRLLHLRQWAIAPRADMDER